MRLKKIGAILCILVVSFLLLVLLPVPALALDGFINPINPTTGPVGTLVNISGTGFTANSTYTILIDTVPVATGTIVAGNLVATTFTMPAIPAGIHAITVTTSAGDTTPIAKNFTVTPQITLVTVTGQVGDVVSVLGTGFGSSLTVNTIFDLGSIGSTSTNISGSFNLSFTVPQRRGGFHTLTSTDSALNAATTNFTINPSLVLSAPTTTVGAQVTITGNGFNPSVAVTVSLDGVIVATPNSNVNGSFSQGLTVPPKAKGVYALAALDSLSSGVATTLTIAHAVTTNPTSFTGGSQVTITGTGFAASSRVSLAIDDEVTSADITTTNATGGFTISNFKIPELPGGSHVLKLSDASDNSITLNFEVVQSATITPQSGTVGTVIQMTGRGFKANAGITVRIDGTVVKTTPPSITTDASGKFSASFTAPASSGGAHPVVVGDGTLSANASFTISAGGGITVNRGTVSQSVTFNGTGFAARGNITVTYDGAVVTSVTADASGAFNAVFNVPASAAGNHAVVATDGTRNMSFTFSVTPSVTLNPASGAVGSKVTVNGSGFTSKGQISIKYDDQQLANTAADNTGGFAFVFDAPVSKGGAHSVIVTDGAYTVTSSFAMDAEAPPVPLPLNPQNDSQAERLALFQWTGVSDPSGVTYRLQLSREANFGVLVLEKQGLTGTGYTITEEEKLRSASRKQPYYWRIKATDAASNESAWSPAQSFYVGIVLPGWLQGVLVALVVVIVGVLAFWFGGKRGKGKIPATGT
ncbi:MAG: IPT/TIG domain-containing protein [Dehalococcoidia bacterium]|nr:IPT/TIG domain-containing protein [Dehalococcoidia bacterium]